MNIYFDENKQAYSNLETLEGWGHTCIATIDSALWEKYTNTDKWDIVGGTFCDITDTDEYRDKKRQESFAQIRQECIETSIGYLRRETKAGGLLSVFNTYMIIVQAQGKLPEGVLLIYREDGTTFYNSEMSAQEFQSLFNEVTDAYLKYFKE